MSYQVLARKYRPRTFHDVVGQEHAVRALINALDEDRLHHAYLFTGTRGVGKTTIARILANCLNCETGVTSTPCGACAPCQEILEGRFVDLIEVDAASRTGVDDTRDLLNNVQYLPTRGRYKVYLIDEVHMLSTSSFNALLKTLEEPPPHVKFLFATTDPKKVPITVLSRCLQFNLKNIVPEVIVAYLRKVLEEEAIETDAASLAVIARAADGSMRDALSLTDQAVAYCGGTLEGDQVADMLGTVRRDEVGRLLQALADGDRTGLFQCSADLASRSANFADVLANLQRAFHELAMAIATGTSPGDDLAAFANIFSAQWLQLGYQIALMGGRDLQYAPEPRVGFEMTLIRLLDFEPAGAAQGEGEGGQAVSRTSSGSETTGSADAAASSAVSVDPISAAALDAPPTARSANAVDRPWHEQVAALAAKGVTGMILEHSNLVSRSPGRIEIVLDRNHDTLYNETQHARLVELFQAQEQASMQVVVALGDPFEETPAARRDRQARERLEAAESALRQDVHVQALMAEFDGRLDGIRALSE